MSENRFQSKIHHIRLLFKNAIDWIGGHSDGILYYTILLFALLILGTAAYRYRGIEPTDVEAAPVVQTSVEENTDMYLSSLPASLFGENREIPVWPVSEADIVCGYQTDGLIWSEDLQQWQTHEATDFSANAGEAVFAVLDGVVSEAYSDSLYGNTVIIDHGNGRVISYSSLSTLNLISVGQKVKKGEAISAAGECIAEHSTGIHVHIEYFLNGKRMDFEQFMKEETGNIADPLQD